MKTFFLGWEMLVPAAPKEDYHFSLSCESLCFVPRQDRFCVEGAYKIPDVSLVNMFIRHRSSPLSSAVRVSAVSSRQVSNRSAASVAYIGLHWYSLGCSLQHCHCCVFYEEIHPGLSDPLFCEMGYISPQASYYQLDSKLLAVVCSLHLSSPGTSSQSCGRSSRVHSLTFAVCADEYAPGASTTWAPPADVEKP